MHRRLNWSGLAVLAALAAIAVFLTASFLPFFMGEAWAQPWNPPAAGRSFIRAGPLCGLSSWALLAAIPLSSVLVSGLFVMVMAIFLLGQRRH